MHDGSSAFLPERSIFLYFGAFKTETLQIYSLIGQTLKQLSLQCRCLVKNIHLATLRLGRIYSTIHLTSGNNKLLNFH